MKRRTILSSLNLAVTLVLLGVLFIFVNFISSRRYARWDLTRQQMTALSQQTTQVLRGLTQPVSITVFYQPRHRLYELVQDLLEEYRRASSQIQVEFVDPEQDPARTQQLVNEFAIDTPNLVIFKSGTRHKYLTDTDLAEYDYSTMTMTAEPRVKSFKGEEGFTSAIVSITQEAQPLIWLTSGHGEKAADEQTPMGASELKRHLEQQNMQVEQVTLLERTEIPADVTLLVLLGPSRRFAEPELLLLEQYLDRGGRMLVLLDPLVDSGLEGLCQRWGIRLGLDIVVDPTRQLPFGSAANLFVTTYTQHPIVEKMKTLMTLYPVARSVSPVEPAPPQISVVPLALTSPQGWGETNTSNPRFQFDEGQDTKGPVTIAVAAERRKPAQDPANAETRTRLVVIGDSDFIVDAQLGNIGNRDLLMGAIFWLVEQETRIGISPKPIESIRLNMTREKLAPIFWMSLLLMPALCGLAGVGVWWRRRT
jgi:ABC-type uncharacterized transport system involved in gliding motility auxiliary subunit